MSITTKVTLTRTQRRTILRLMLRDSSSTVWSDAVLNFCLDEGLTLVQARYPLIKVTAITVTTALSYALPVECLGVVEVFRTTAKAATDGTDPEPYGLIGSQGVTLATGWGVSANQYARLLKIDSQSLVDAGDILLVWYRAAQQPWGDPSDVAFDSVVKDLCPTGLQDGEAALLLYAGARVAALRYATQIIGGGGGRDYLEELKIALAERDELAQTVGSRPRLTVRNGLFG